MTSTRSADFHSGGLFSADDDRTDTDEVERRQPARDRQLGAEPELQRQRAGREGLPPRRRQRSAEHPAVLGQRHRRPSDGFQTYKDETLWNYEAGFKYSKHGVTFNAAAFYNDIKNLQVTLDAGSCSSRIVFNVPKAHAEGIEAEFSVHPLVGLDLSFAGSLLNSKFESSVISNRCGVETGIREGNRLPTVPKYQIGGDGQLRVAVQLQLRLVRERPASAYRQIASRSRATRSRRWHHQPYSSSIRSRLVRRRSRHRLGHASRFRPIRWSMRRSGLRWDNGLELVAYVKNIFDVDPKLSLDRERGLRARIGYEVGQPRTIGLTVRYSFGGPRDAAAAAAASAAAAAGDADLPRRSVIRRRDLPVRRRHRRRRRRSSGANAADQSGHEF